MNKRTKQIIKMNKPNYKDILIHIGLVVLIIAIGVLTSGCKQIQYIEKPIHIHDTTYQTKIVVDSTIQLDSVFVERRGDTIYKDKIVIKERWRTRTDTFREVRIDSIAYPVYIKDDAPAKKDGFFKRLYNGIDSLLWLILAIVIVTAVIVIIRRLTKR